MKIGTEQKFLEKFHCDEALKYVKDRGFTCELLCGIKDDYETNFYNDYQCISDEIISILHKDKPSDIKIIYGRAKAPDHLIEKIVRKIGKENSSKYSSIEIETYRKIITDLIGIRILTLKREDWETVDLHIRKVFKDNIIESKAYVCYGDRDVYFGKIKTEYTNKGYRSQHYIIQYKNISCEVQVRTLAEEVYGEFDHQMRYPYRANNKFLVRYNHIVSKAVSELDDLISTCCKLPDEELDRLDKVCNEDTYKDWKADRTTIEDIDRKYSKETEALEVLKSRIYTRKG